MQYNDCRRKKTTFSAHLARPPGQSPPKRKMTCPGQSSGLCEKLHQIKPSAVSELMPFKQADTQTKNPPWGANYHGRMYTYATELA